MASLRPRDARTDATWPGFVDALSTLLLVIIFLLVVFVLAQFILGRAVSERDAALADLNAEIAELAELLALERASNAELTEAVGQLSASLSGKTAEADALQALVLDLRTRAENAEDEVAGLRARTADLEAELDAAAEVAAETAAAREAAEGRIVVLTDALDAERQLSSEAQAQVAILNQQIAALRAQLQRIEAALEAEERKTAEQNVQIAELGRRLNLALASRVEELSRYRSEFFGRLRAALGDRPDIQIVGDRFVFQSEVLFESGAATLDPGGAAQLDALAETLLAVAEDIPDDLPWILRVDGHTDVVPIGGAAFRDNWELSTERALSVTRYLLGQGVPAERLAATGFGEYHPIDAGTDEIALRRNRRIELKLTQR